MKRVTNEILKKEFKKINGYLVIGLVCVVLTLICYGLTFYSMNREPKDAVYLNEVIEDQNNKTGVTASLDVAYKPFLFAGYPGETNKSFYIVYDGTYYYIAYMTNKDFDKLNIDGLDKKPEKVFGKTKTVPSDIKRLAIQAYNKGLEEDKQITLSDFNSYFGGVYLDMTEIDDAMTIIMMLIAFITNICALTYILMFIIKRIQTSSALKKIDDDELQKIEKELDDKDTFHYEKAHLILTKNFIVSFLGKMYILNYKDMIMMYEHRLRQYGITTTKSLMIMNKYGKTRAILQVDGITKKSKAIIDEVAETIASKNENLIIGYTSENLKKAREIAKKNKELLK